MARNLAAAANVNAVNNSQHSQQKGDRPMCADTTNEDTTLQIIEFGPFSHQDLINAFAFAATGLDLEDPWALMAKCGLDVQALAADREAPYTGTPLQDLPNLTAAEQNMLMRQLDRVLKTMPVPPRPAVDENDADAAQLAPTDDQRLDVPENGTWQMVRVAETWNCYGGYLAAEAETFHVDPATPVAILLTESSGDAFDEGGRMIIRFEPHIFYRSWGASHDETFRRFFRYDPSKPWNAPGQYEWRPDPGQPWRNIGRNQDEMWAAFEAARRLDEAQAMCAISMGLAQLMGFNHSLIGYSSVQEMFHTLATSERAQLLGFFDFLRAKGLADAIQRRDYLRVATVYNGAGQAQVYAGLIQTWAALFEQVRGPVAAAAPAAPTAAPPLAMPMPGKPPELVPEEETGGRPLREADPELYAAWREHIQQGYRNNQIMFNRILEGFMNPYHTTIWMYRIMFGVGIAAFVAAVVIALVADDPVTALGGAALFGGLSVVAFLSYFLNRPLQALEENLQFITWLGIVYNTYWTRLAYAMDMDTFQAEIEDATDDAVAKIKEMLDEHGKRSDKRPGLR